ncbi:hypothetical protein EGM51_09065 [Verrucomicrobia bacterium S94]|nr:hypothetical protein EGM51_09065 [Verrucomicrobia bacterium S94]
MRIFVLLVSGMLAGCASTGSKVYKPHSSREKKAFVRADRSVTFADVQTNFQTYLETEVAWAGVIRGIEFKETERTIQVAFDIDYHDFDWRNYGGGKPYRLAAENGGRFKAGWTVDKPTRISYLKTLAKPGYMILVYGKPWRRDDTAVLLAATAVRLVSTGDYELLPEEGMEHQTELLRESEGAELQSDTVFGKNKNRPVQNL